MSRDARITTIIPTYKRPDLLKRAVFSVLNQSYPDFIVRILDNASDDDTESVARELMKADGRVQYHRHEQNIGGLSNIIFGIDTVTTEFFSVLSDDDLLMPGFFQCALDMHQRSSAPLAFAATKVVVVDDRARFGAPWPYPERHCRFAPPDGILQCLRAGVSLPGVVYRTSVMKQIGPPRFAWWNWTESGWHALAAVESPIEFSPEVGAIVYVHPGSASKRMDRTEFRISWFRMLVELREAALRNGVSEHWWATHVRPLTSSRFIGTVIRLCDREGVRSYDALGALALSGGLGARRVAAVLSAARAARVIGIGRLVNASLDAFLRLRGWWSRMPSQPSAGATDGAAAAPPSVFADLNRRAGLQVQG